MKNFGLLLIFTFILSSCFDKGGGDKESAGGGLFVSNHQSVENAFSIGIPSSKTYKTSEDINFVLTHPFEITVTGTPRIAIDVNGTTKYANFKSGSGSKYLLFAYQTVAGDIDSDGITINSSNLDLNNGTLKFSSSGTLHDASLSIPSIDTSGLKIDTISPQINLVSIPNSQTYTLGETLAFYIYFDETVYVSGSPQIKLDIEGSEVKASFVSGSGSQLLVFKYIVQSSDLDVVNGIEMSSPVLLNSGTITDEIGNAADLTFTPTPMPFVYVNGTAPSVKKVNLPAAKTYYNGEALDYILEFSSAVSVTGIPRIALDMGGTTVYANYHAGSGSSNLTFRHIVTTTDEDSNGVQIGASIDANSGTIKNASNTDAILSFTPPLSPGVIVYGPIPKIESITAVADGTYSTSEYLDFTIEFSENVAVSGVPEVSLDLSSGAVGSKYISGSNSKSIIFRHIITDSDLDIDGLTFENATINLSGGTIKSVATAMSANLDFNGTEPDMTNIRVNAGSATQLAITTQPVDTQQNAMITPSITVEIRNGDNDLVVGSTASVTIAIITDPSSGSATLGGTLTQAAVAGIATFDDITIDNIQSGYALQASSTGLASATTDTFDITVPAPTKLSFTTHPVDTIAGSTMSSFTVEIQDGAGNLVNTSTDDITISFETDPSTSTAILSGTLTQTAVAGVATFNDVNIDKSFEAYEFKASATGLTDGVSDAFNITAGTATKLAFIDQPTNTNLNTNISPAITVEIQDALGNRTSDTDSVTLAINNNPNAANLAGTLSVAAVDGTATFSDIQLDALGIGYTLDTTATGLTTATSEAFNVTTVPTQLIITQQPTNSSNGVVIDPAMTVEIRDASNALVLGSNLDVTVALNTDPSAGSATLSGTLTQTADNGVATFDDLYLDDIQNGYDLIFTSTGLTDAISDSFNISFVAAEIQFNSTGSTVYENEKSISITIDKSAAGGTAVTVPYTVTGTSTGGGTDHDLADGNIVFNSGETTQTLSFNITEDFTTDPDETIIITLGTPDSGNLGTNTIHTITLKEPLVFPSNMCVTTTSSNANGILLDSGGLNSDYSNDEDCSFLIQPTGATFVTLGPDSFTTNSAADVLTIYDGTSAAGTLIGTFSVATFIANGPVTANSGAMFIKWDSDSTITDDGFDLKWKSDGALTLASEKSTIEVNETTAISGIGGAPPYTYSIESGNGNITGGIYTAGAAAETVTLRVTDSLSVTADLIIDVIDTATLPESKICVFTSSTDPSGKLFDSGGSYFGYGNNENCSFLIQPAGASEIVLSANSFNTDNFADYMKVYDGTDNSGTLLGHFHTNDTITPLTSSSGALFVEWITNGSGGGTGFELLWTSNAPVKLNVNKTTMETNATLEMSGVGGTSPYTYSIVSGTGSISGTTFTSGTITEEVVLRVTDADSNTDDVTINIIDSVALIENVMCSITSSTDPSGKIYDSGGSLTSYDANEDCSFLIQPTGATQIELSALLFDSDSAADRISIYDGVDDSAPLLAQYDGSGANFLTVTSTGNAMFLKWTTNPSGQNEGFELIWNSNAPVKLNTTAQSVATNGTLELSGVGGELPYTYSIVSGGGSITNTTYTAGATPEQVVLRVTDNNSVTDDVTIDVIDNSTLVDNIICTNTTSNEVSGEIYDDGGSGSNYTANQDCGFLIQPNNAATITLSSIAWDVHPFGNYDWMKIYDGTDNTGTLIANYNGTSAFQPVVASSGSLYIEWHSNINDVASGFNLLWTSETAPAQVDEDLLPAKSICTFTTATDPTGKVYDSGGNSGGYQNNETCDFLIQPAGATEVKLNANLFDTFSSADYIKIFDGTNNSGNLLGQYDTNDTIPELTGASGSIFIEWVSDGGSTDTGFEFIWTSDAPLQLTTENDTTKVNDTVEITGTGGTPPYLFSIVSGGGSLNGSTYTAGATPESVTLRVTDSDSNTADKTIEVIDTALIDKQNMCVTTSSNDPEGRLYDSGGPTGYYGHNQNCSFLIQPTGATQINLSAISWNVHSSSNLDYMKIYEGADNSGTLLAVITGSDTFTPISSTSSALFIEWVSDTAASATGYELLWDSNAPVSLNLSDSTVEINESVEMTGTGGVTPYTYSIVSGGGSITGSTYTAGTSAETVTLRVTDNNAVTADAELQVVDSSLIEKQNMCTITSTTDPTGRIFDDGGASGRYGHNKDCGFLIQPTGATEINLSAIFWNVYFDANNDWLKIYDGTDNTGTLLAWMTGSDTFTPLTATSGAMYLEWHTNVSANLDGFELLWNSNAPVNINLSKSIVNVNETLEISGVGGEAPYTYSIVSGDGSITGSTYTAPATTGTVVLRVTDNNAVTVDKTVEIIDEDALAYNKMCYDTISTMASGQLFDDQGPSNDYSHNKDCSFTIQPTGATQILISADLWKLYALPGDTMKIYEGTDNTGDIVAFVSGIDSFQPIIVNASAVYIEWHTDHYATDDGFKLTWTSNADLDLSIPNTSIDINSSIDVLGNGGTPPYTYSVASGGGSFTNNTYTAGGSVETVTLRVTDNNSDTADKTINIIDTATLADLAMCNDTTSTDNDGQLFDSGGAGSNYADNETCTFLIQPANGNPVVISNSEFDLYHSNDVLNIYNGANNSAPLIAKYTSGDVISDVVADSGSMYLEWSTNYYGNGTGYNFTWTTKPLPSIEFESTTSSVIENTGSAIITITKSEASTTPVTVPYTITGTSTNGGTDHDLADGNIVFAIGETSQTITVNITDDLVSDDNETIIITLGTPDVGELGTNTVHTITIDEPTLPMSLMCGTTSTTLSSGSLFDSGGGASNYSNDEDCSFLIQPTGATTVTLGPSSFATNSANDVLTVYDGTSAAGTLLGTFSVATFIANGSVTATSGAMFVKWDTDSATTDTGFELIWSSDGGVTLQVDKPNINTTETVNLSAIGGSAPYTYSIVSGDGTISGSVFTAGSSSGPVILRVTDNDSNTADKTIQVISTNTISTTRMCQFTSSTNATGRLTDSNNGYNDSYYDHNESCTFLIQPTGATQVELTTDYFHTNSENDWAKIYDGTDNTGILLAHLHSSGGVPPVIATSGSIFVEWESDSAHSYTGFEFTWNSNASLALSVSSESTTIDSNVTLAASGGAPPYTYSIVSGGGSITNNTYTAGSTVETVTVRVTDNDATTVDKNIEIINTQNLTGNRICDVTTLTDPDGRIYDSGGSGNNYSDNENCGLLIQPTGASVINLSANSFRTHSTSDTLKVYDGVNNSATLLAEYSKEDAFIPLTSSAGSLYLEWSSNYAYSTPGFSLIWNSDASVQLKLSANTTTVDSTIDLSGVGGTPPYTYSIVSGGGSITDDVYTAPSSVEENIILRVTDDNSNTHDQTINIINSVNEKRMCFGTNSTTDPSGVIYDSGGIGQTYSDNENCSFLIQPASATSINLSAVSFRTHSSSDYMKVYDGIDNTGVYLGVYASTDTFPPLTATSGSLYLEWITNSSYASNGFKLAWNSDSPVKLNSSANIVNINDTLDLTGVGGEPPYTYSVVSGGGSVTGSVYTAGTTSETVTLRVTDNNSVASDKEIEVVNTASITNATICSDSTTTTSEGVIYDSGGSGGTYSDNETCSYLIQPSGSIGEIELTSKMFDVYNTSDNLRIYDGTDNSGTLLGVFNHNDTIDSVKATSGAMYIEWTSNNSYSDHGFELLWTASSQAADLSFNTSSAHNFGTVSLGESTSQVFTVTNNGNFTASSVAFSGLVAPYSLGANSTCSSSLTANGTCNVEVVFTPTSTGAHNDTLVLNYNDGSGPATTENKTLSGTGGSNNAPVAIDDPGFLVQANNDLVINTSNLIANDTDIDADTISFNTVATTSANGATIVDNANGTITYTPPTNFTGIDSFSYTIDDGNTATDSAQIEVTVQALETSSSVVRYYFDQWPSGKVHNDAVGASNLTYDGIENPYSLNADNDDSSMTYVEDGSGHKGINWSNSSQNDSFKRPNIGSQSKIVSMLNNSKKMTLEIVFDISSCSSDFSHIFFLGSTGYGSITVGCKDDNSLILSLGSTSMANQYGMSYNIRDKGRMLLTIALDTTQATASDRVKFYKDGTFIGNCSICPTLNQQISIDNADDLSIGNKYYSSLGFTGTMYYMALYNDSLSTTSISENATALLSNDDRPNTKPTPMIYPNVAVVNGKTKESNPIPMTIAFDEDVTGFTLGDINITGFGTLSNFSAVNATTYTFDVTPTADPATFTLSVSSNVALDNESAGNNAAIPYTFSYDSNAPNVEVLLVTKTTTADDAIKSDLEARGFTVTKVDDTICATSDANGKDIVLISASVSSTNVAAKFRDVSVPVINWEPSINDDMNITAGAVTNTDFGYIGETSIEIVKTNHPLATGLSYGNHVLLTSTVDMNWANPEENAKVIAQAPGNNNKAFLFYYPRGSEMANSFTAPSLRVSVWLYDTTYSNHNSIGNNLWNSTFNWAIRQP